MMFHQSVSAPSFSVSFVRPVARPLATRSDTLNRSSIAFALFIDSIARAFTLSTTCVEI